VTLPAGDLAGAIDQITARLTAEEQR
jgi:hypothetical protein